MYRDGSLVQYVTSWDELIFILKPDKDLRSVMVSFERFFNEYNGLVGCNVSSRSYDAEGAGMLYAMSGGNTVDSVAMYFVRSEKSEFIVRLCASGTTDKSTRAIYDQVKKFFTEQANDTLEIERWGEGADTPEQVGTKRVCHKCGEAVRGIETRYCPHCGTEMPTDSSQSTSTTTRAGVKIKKSVTRR